MPEWLQALSWTSLAVGSVYILVTKGILPLWNFAAAAIKLAEAVPTIMDIHEEFQPNSGKSMIDKIESIIVGQDNIQKQFENRIAIHDDYHGELEQRLDVLEA